MSKTSSIILDQAITLVLDHSTLHHRLSQVSHHTITLDSPIAKLYTVHISTIHIASVEELITRTLHTRCLNNQTCASWRKSIEQLVKTTEISYHIQITISITGIY